MPDSFDPQGPPKVPWTTVVRTRLGDAAGDDDVVEEIAQHAEELYRTHRVAGRSREEARLAVEAEMASSLYDSSIFSGSEDHGIDRS